MSEVEVAIILCVDVKVVLKRGVIIVRKNAAAERCFLKVNDVVWFVDRRLVLGVYGQKV